MIQNILIIFAITAIGGIILASHSLKSKPAPWALSIIHALLGATGLILLGITAYHAGWPTKLSSALVILIVAALGGFYLASHHLQGKIAPKGVVIIHAVVAIIGFLILLTTYLAMK